MFLWAGLVRVFFLHHVTWSINSVCHFTGKRRFDVEDHSSNVFWLAIPSLGEAWHHNHHAFPRSAAHGLRSGEVDPVGRADLGDGEAAPRPQRRADHARAPGSDDRGRPEKAAAPPSPQPPRRVRPRINQI